MVSQGTGMLEARLTWTNGQLRLDLTCQESLPPYTGCGGGYNRTGNTTGVYTTSVTAKEYLLGVANFGAQTGEPYTLTVLFP